MEGREEGNSFLLHTLISFTIGSILEVAVLAKPATEDPVTISIPPLLTPCLSG